MNCDKKKLLKRFGDTSIFGKTFFCWNLEKFIFYFRQFFSLKKNWDSKIFYDQICDITTFVAKFSFVETKLDQVGPVDHIPSTN